ncbi:hypothetical protein HELRODRAFT_165087 [Helobdella robusta]|uniref:Uncharacterized protein n=1 Tax=Helobdella robusta TaxID=6412 RepID=T1EWA0_HELRO|nr:hypothetical protein HELRODRAFT_165087 [Helobdella robusta]ESN92946.1 hypothetical protein HELRODRAFT_165087 [Helobdella robusta]
MQFEQDLIRSDSEISRTFEKRRKNIFEEFGEKLLTRFLNHLLNSSGTNRQQTQKYDTWAYVCEIDSYRQQRHSVTVDVGYIYKDSTAYEKLLNERKQPDKPFKNRLHDQHNMTISRSVLTTSTKILCHVH